jgi:two-component system cell cycle response regulator DivK
MKKILIIEDNPGNMELVSAVLEKEGYKILKASEAMTGIRLANKEKPDLILMDIQLPVIDGLEAAHLLKEEEGTQNIKIVALTALSGEKKKILKYCDGYISKPLNIDSFIETIRSYLESC